MTNKKPYIKLKIFGNLSLIFWENEHKTDDRKYEALDPVLSSSFKNTKGEWINQAIPIPFNALYRLVAMGSKLKYVEDNYKEEKRNNKEETQETIDEENV